MGSGLIIYALFESYGIAVVSKVGSVCAGGAYKAMNVRVH